MSKAPAMPMYWDAYLADTTHLTTEEHGAYLLLLGAMWRRNGWVPDHDKDNARILGVTVSKWKKIKARLRAFLIFENGLISQKNLLKNWKNTQEKIQKNKENGAKGGRARFNKNSNLVQANGSNSLKPNPSIPDPDPKPDNKIEPKGSLSVSAKPTTKRNTYPEDFEEFWKGYPTSPNMSKKEAFDVWKKFDPDDRAKAIRALPGFCAYCRKNPDYSPLHACRFLKYRRFDGFAEQRPVAKSEPEQVLVSIHDDPELFDFCIDFRRRRDPNFNDRGREHVRVPAPLLDTFKQQKAGVF